MIPGLCSQSDCKGGVVLSRGGKGRNGADDTSR